MKQTIYKYYQRHPELSILSIFFFCVFLVLCSASQSTFLNIFLENLADLITIIAIPLGVLIWQKQFFLERKKDHVLGLFREVNKLF